MPASSGRVRMPHNNRMSTSATLKTHAIWQTAIGHDPYANDTEKKDGGVTDADKEKARSVLEMARSQNLTDGAKRDNFTAALYRGLKGGKQRRAGAVQGPEPIDPQLQQLLEDPSSSSEEEFVEVEVKKREKKESSSSKRKHRKHRRDDSSSESDDSSDESSRDRKERRKRHKKHHGKRSRHATSSDSDSSDSEEDRRSKKRKDKRKHKERKKSSRRDHK